MGSMIPRAASSFNFRHKMSKTKHSYIYVFSLEHKKHKLIKHTDTNILFFILHLENPPQHTSSRASEPPIRWWALPNTRTHIRPCWMLLMQWHLCLCLACPQPLNWSQRIVRNDTVSNEKECARHLCFFPLFFLFIFWEFFFIKGAHFQTWLSLCAKQIKDCLFLLFLFKNEKEGKER